MSRVWRGGEKAPSEVTIDGSPRRSETVKVVGVWLIAGLLYIAADALVANALDLDTDKPVLATTIRTGDQIAKIVTDFVEWGAVNIS